MTHLLTSKPENLTPPKQGLPTDPAFIASIESWAKRTLIVPPRMNATFRSIWKFRRSFRNLRHQMIFSLLDWRRLYRSDLFLKLFYSRSLLSRRKTDLLSARIQKKDLAGNWHLLYHRPQQCQSPSCQASLGQWSQALPKYAPNWSYEDVESKVWKLPQLTDFGALDVTEKRLQKIGITSIAELAQAHPDLLKKEFGVMGLQLWFHAHGIDESNVHKPYHPKSRGIGNSQILPYDYHIQADIELVFREMAEQVAIRLRWKKRRPSWSPFMPPTPKLRDFRPFTASKRLSPPNPPRFLSDTVLRLFRSRYEGESHSADWCFYGELVEESLQLLSLFDDPVALEKGETPADHWPHFGINLAFTSLQKGSSLLENSRAIARSKLTGGHSAGGLDGLTWSTVLISLINPAREFQDRGMAKWAGFFFIRAHNCLHTKEIDRSQLTILPLAELAARKLTDDYKRIESR